MKIFYFLLLTTLIFSSCEKDNYAYKNLDVSKEDISKWVAISHNYQEIGGITYCNTTIESQKSMRTFTIKSTVTWLTPEGFTEYKVVKYPLAPKEIVTFCTEEVQDGSLEMKFIKIFKHV